MYKNIEKLFRTGYLGPFSLPDIKLPLLIADIERYASHCAWPGNNYSNALDQLPWFKSFHSLSTPFLDTALHPDLLSIVHNTFQNKPTKLWGVAPLVKKAGAVHPWHSDIETRCWPTLTIWLGLKGVNKDTSLQLISHTHKLEKTPDVLRKEGVPVGSNVEVLSAAKELCTDCELIIPDMKDGDYMILLGSLWHGTHNTSSNTRYAVTLQYSDINADIRVPLNFEKPVHWHKQKPYCYRTNIDN